MDAAIAIVMLVPVLLAVALIIGVIRKNVSERRAGDPVDIRGAIPAIVVLLVAVLVIGSMADVAEDRGLELYDCVPASHFGSNISIDGDCAEIVTIGGEDYVRMTAVGTFSVSSGGGTREYTVGPAHMDLVLLTGQSNSVFYTSPQYYEGVSPVAPGEAFYLGTEEGSGTLAGLAKSSDITTSGIVDMVAEDGGVRVAQMYPAFMSGYVNETGHRVLVVNSGIGGRSITYWDPGQECDLWTEKVLERVQQLASDGSIVLNPAAVLWSQGEADADETEEFYYDRLQTLVERLSGDAYLYSFPKVLSVLPRHPDYAEEINPALAQTAFAEESDVFFVASKLPLYLSRPQTRDGIHYTQEAFGWLGEAFAREAASCTGLTPEVQTIVLTEKIGIVSELPDKVESYGTSGQAFQLDARWTAVEGGYAATLSGNPYGTRILEGLEATAVLSNYRELITWISQ